MIICVASEIQYTKFAKLQIQWLKQNPGNNQILIVILLR